MSFYDHAVNTAEGAETALAVYRDQVVLAVNVASKCGFTPQYAGLQALQDKYAQQGFTVLGFPCNQFLFQEPGGPESTAACATSYGVTFPIFAKLKVRGRGRHPLFAELSSTPDAEGKAGAVKWNFEKVLIGRDGTAVRRFRSKVAPDDPQLTAAIDEALAG